MKWFEEFYPEIFDFQYLNKRLKLYRLEHDLDTLVWFPESDKTREMIKCVLKQN